MDNNTLGINIDCSKLSNMDKRLLGSSVFKDLIEHFNNPENQKRFKEWKKEREKARQAGTQNAETNRKEDKRE